MESKVCTKCKLEKPLDQYAQRKDRPGRRAYCRACNCARIYEVRKTEHGAELRAKYRRNRKATGKTDAGFTWARMRISPRNKAIGFEISKEDFIRFFDSMSTCEYCGCTIDEFRNDLKFIRDYDGECEEITKRKHILSVAQADSVRLSIDRKCNEGPYSVENICASCWFCNSIKNRYIPHAAMLVIGRNLRARLEIAKRY